MNLQGVCKIEVAPRYGYRIVKHWSRCYWGEYQQPNPRPAYRLDGRTKIWARNQDYNRPPRRKRK